MTKKTNAKRRVIALVFAVALCLLSIIPLSTVSASADDSGIATTAVCQHAWSTLPSGARNCNLCGMTCRDHNFEITSISHDGNYSETYHQFWNVCVVCDYAVYTEVDTLHSWTNGVCRDCGYVCKHDFSDPSHKCVYCHMSSADYGCQHTFNHYADKSVCTKCNFTCTEHDWMLECISADNSSHTYRYYCYVCGVRRPTDLIGSHNFNLGICTDCGYVCKHDFSESPTECSNCRIQHPRHTLEYIPNYNGDGRLTQYTYRCTFAGCDFSVNYESPLDYLEAMYFNPAPFLARWNVNFPIRTAHRNARPTERVYWRPYTRFVPATYSELYSYKATAYLTAPMETFEIPLKTTRYLTMRLRLYDVDTFELSIYAGLNPQSVDGVLPGTGSGSFKKYNINVANLEKETWINVVFDLYAHDCYMSVGGDPKGYEPNKLIDNLSAYLCAHFTSDKGYIDCEYVAFIDDLDSLDTLMHFYAYSSHTESYYLYSDDGFSFVNQSHSYEKGVCRNCSTKCVHLKYEYGYCTTCGMFAQIGGYDNEMGMFALFTSVYDAQMNTFMSMLNYDILGVNIASLVIALVVIIISVIIFKKVI